MRCWWLQVSERSYARALLAIACVTSPLLWAACDSSSNGDPSAFPGASSDAANADATEEGSLAVDGALINYDYDGASGETDGASGSLTEGGVDAASSDASIPACAMGGAYCPSKAMCVANCSICGSGLLSCGVGSLAATPVCKTPYDCANDNNPACTTSASCANNNDICVGKKCVPCAKGYDGNACKGGGTCTGGSCL